MYQLTNQRQSPFSIWHDQFYKDIMERALVDNYVSQAGKLYDGSPLPNLHWLTYEDKFLFVQDYLMKNLAYRFAGTDFGNSSYPPSYELFEDDDFERIAEAYRLTDGAAKADYNERFIRDFRVAHRLLNLTHVIAEVTFTNESSPIPMYAARGGGFSCIS